jgi:hypothetical protein
MDIPDEYAQKSRKPPAATRVKLDKPLTIEDMNRIAAAGWAGELDNDE